MAVTLVPGRGEQPAREEPSFLDIAMPSQDVDSRTGWRGCDAR